MSQWIKCSDELPPIDEPVFLHDGALTGIGSRADLHDGSWCWAWAASPPMHDEEGWLVDSFELDDFQPTHWHALPVPPKELIPCS